MLLDRRMDSIGTIEKKKRKTVIVGASTNPGRYSFLATDMLKSYGHPVVPLGIKKGASAGEPILDIRDKPPLSGVDTITLYLRPERQREWYAYLLGLAPKRIIFNPGTENPEFEKYATEKGIETVQGCTLVMLRSHQF